MLTFKPAAGSIVEYQHMGIRRNYLITGYYEEHPQIAKLLDLDTEKEDMIIVEFFSEFYSTNSNITYNTNLTVIG